MRQSQWVIDRNLLAAIVLMAMCHLNNCLFAHGWTSSSLKMTVSDKSRPRVVIAGGGFGGLTCRNQLQTLLPSADITLVEPKERFCFLPLLYEYLGGTADLDEIAPTYKYLLSSRDFPKRSKGKVSLTRGSAIKVDPEAKSLTVKSMPSGDTEELSYDALVVCSGLPPRTSEKIPSSAYTFASLDDAVRLKRRLGALPDNASIVLVGGGYVGSELACTIQSIVPSSSQLTIFHRDPTGVCSGAEAYNRKEAQKRLESLGVNLKLGTTVNNVKKTTSNDGTTYDEVNYSNQDGNEGSIRADILIWTVSGATNHPREVTEGLPVDDRGRIKITQTCQVEGMDSVFAIGDGAVVVSKQGGSEILPGTAQVAMQQAAVAVHNLYLDVEGNSQEPRKTFSYQPLGEMLSLGGDEDASISGLNGLFKLNGPLASTARRLVYAARMPTPQQAVRSGTEYIVGGVSRRLFDTVNKWTR